VRALAAWREQEAQRRDLPRNRVLRDDLLLELAASRPRSAEDIAKLRRVSLDRASITSAMAAVRSALDLPEAELPVVEPPPKLPRGIGPLVDLLRVLLKYQCEEHHVAQRLVATTADLEAIAAFDEPDVPALRGWRLEVFGRQALTLKQGKVGLAVTKGQVVVVPMAGVTAPA
jgi:ribonuclease D